MSYGKKTAPITFCGWCGQTTHYEILSEENYEWTIDYDTGMKIERRADEVRADSDDPNVPRDNSDGAVAPNQGTTQSYIIKCGGCKERSFLQRTKAYQNWTPAGETVETFPGNLNSWRSPKWFAKRDLAGELGQFIHSYLAQIYSCYNSRSFDLVALGVRALIENLLVKKNGEDIGGFEHKLNKFRESGHVTNDQKNILKEVIDLGSAVTHRGTRASRDMAEDALRILESFIEQLFVNPNRKQRIGDATPKRHNRDALPATPANYTLLLPPRPARE